MAFAVQTDPRSDVSLVLQAIHPSSDLKANRGSVLSATYGGCAATGSYLRWGCAGSDLPLTFLGDRTPMRQDTSTLTPREMEVLASLIAGRSNREIAAELNMGIGTVKAHLSAIYEKLGVSNRTQAALVGFRIFPMLRVLSG